MPENNAGPLGQNVERASERAATVADSPRKRFASGTLTRTGARGVARGERLCDVDVRPQLRRDPWPQKVLRRLITVPMLLVVTALWLAAGVIVLPVFFVADLIARRPLLWCRFYISLAVIIAGQLYGIGGMFVIWLISGFGRNYQRCNDLSARWTGYWGQWNLNVLTRVYNMRFTVEGSEVLRDGPTILMSRHASIIDTIMPLGLVQHRHGVRLRIVLKHELLYSATVDTIGHRVPTAFVKRSSGNVERELAAVRKMATGMHAQESVLIFPEGTRYTPAKQADVLSKLQAKDPVAAARAAQLTHVLPLRPGGVLALLDQLPDADVVFCAHTGFEAGAHLEDFFAGGLYAADVHVKYWRVAASAIPTESSARMAFLHNEWLKVNAFVASHSKN
jgi:1-acyl-sn-glycerol-3-phosphate acyltransferase